MARRTANALDATNQAKCNHLFLHFRFDGWI